MVVGGLEELVFKGLAEAVEAGLEAIEAAEIEAVLFPFFSRAGPEVSS